VGEHDDCNYKVMDKSDDGSSVGSTYGSGDGSVDDVNMVTIM